MQVRFGQVTERANRAAQSIELKRGSNGALQRSWPPMAGWHGTACERGRLVDSAGIAQRRCGEANALRHIHKPARV